MLKGEQRENLVQLCQALVRTPSPSGREGELAKLIIGRARAMGYDGISADSYGNVLLRMRFGDGGKKLLFHSQMDHVSPGNPAEWSFYPYGGIIMNSRLYGRGASDQKGALAAMIQAGACLREDGGSGLNGELIVAAVVQQEMFGGFSSRFIASSVSPDAVISGEASDLKIVRGQRGRVKILADTHGRIAHSSHPELGVNAADIMVDAIASLRKNCVVPEDDFLGRGEYVLTGIYTTPLRSEKAIPDRCTASFERGCMLGERPDDILESFRSALTAGLAPEARNAVSISLSVTEGVCYTGAPLIDKQMVPAWVQDEDSAIVRLVKSALSKAGIAPVVSDKPGFGTGGCIYAAEQSLPTLIFGPCRQDQPHSVDEYIELDQLFGACGGYCSIAREFLRC